MRLLSTIDAWPAGRNCRQAHTVATGARLIPACGKKIDNVFQAGQVNVKEPVLGGFKPVTVPSSGNGTQSPPIIGAAEPVKHHVEPMKPMLPMKPVLHI